MKLLFKQKVFSWFDSYDIYDEYGNIVFQVKGQLSWGHKLAVYDAAGRQLGMLQEKIFTFLPCFEVYLGNTYMGSISKEFTFLRPRYHVDFNGWQVEGNMMEWDYQIVAPNGYPVANISKELFHWSDTYVIDVINPDDALAALMFVLAIDAEKCSRNNG